MIRFHLHGAVELQAADGRSLLSVLSQPKRTALLAYLVIADPGGFQRRDTLLALFWPELDEQRARNALSQALHYLRRSLGEGVIVGRGESEVGIAEGMLWCDAVAFHEACEAGRLEEALEIQRGEILPGLNLNGVPEFERWLDLVRARTRDRAARAAWQLAERAERAEDVLAAAAWARRATGLQPDDEAALRRLLILLDRAGDRAGALHTYEAFARRLELEFDAVPSVPTRDLIAALRARASNPGATAAGADPASAEPGIHSAISAGIGSGSAPGDTVSDTDSAAEREMATMIAPPTGSEVEAGVSIGGTSAGRPGAHIADPPAALLAERSRIIRWAGGLRRERGWYLGVVLILVSLAALASLAGISFLRLGAVPKLVGAGPGAVVVFPFDIQGGDDLGYLGRGMTDLLSAKLDGAGGLRSVDPRAVLGLVARDEAAVHDRRGAGMIAERLGAELFILGSLVAHGGRVQLNASLYDRGRGTPLVQATVEGPGEQIFGLVDRLTAQLLIKHQPGPETSMARLAATTTTSLPALKAYLEGESALRAGRYALAQEFFQEATALDTTFALAYYRLAVAAVWSEPDSRLPGWAVQQAIHHGDRLAERARLLLHAFQAFIGRDAIEAEQLYRAVLATHPDDVEAWYQLGEVLFHYGPLVGSPLEESAMPFERVLYFEPAHGESLMHLARVAARRRDRIGLDSLVSRLLAAAPERDRLLELRALQVAVERDSAAWSRIAGASTQLTDPHLMTILFTTVAHGGDYDAGIELARQLAHPNRLPFYRALGYGMGAQIELARGRWTAARAQLEELARLERASALIIAALFASSPLTPATAGEVEELRARTALLELDAAAPAFRSIGIAPAHLPFLRHYLAGLLSVRLGDRAGALAHGHSLAELGGVQQDPALGQGLAWSIDAASAWRAEDLEQTLHALREVPLGPQQLKAALGYAAQGYERFLFGEALAAAGRDDEALRWYGTFPEPGGYDLIYLAPSHLRRAEIYDRQGDRPRAALHYARFIELWAECDPELRPMVEVARERLARLND